jgi:5-methylcytosine-specific restriction endonuclease McrA
MVPADEAVRPMSRLGSGPADEPARPGARPMNRLGSAVRSDGVFPPEIGQRASESKNLVAHRVLLLNATFEPLAVVSSRRALLLVLATKAELVHATDRLFRSERLTVAEPLVVRLTRYVRIPHAFQIAVNRRTVFARDEARCQYCGAAAENLDHVVPRSRGGGHSWENVVACCRRCNSRKEDRLPHEVGLVLRRPPKVPGSRVGLQALSGGIHEDWHPYLPAESLTA